MNLFSSKTHCKVQCQIQMNIFTQTIKYCPLNYVLQTKITLIFEIIIIRWILKYSWKGITESLEPYTKIIILHHPPLRFQLSKHTKFFFQRCWIIYFDPNIYFFIKLVLILLNDFLFYQNDLILPRYVSIPWKSFYL